MNLADVDFFNQLLLFFEDHCMFGYKALAPHAIALIMALGTIDIAATWTLYSGQLRMSEIISRVMKIGLFMFFIINFDKINQAILVSFQYAGLTAAGSAVGGSDILKPSTIITDGFKAIEPILSSLISVTSILPGIMAMKLVYIAITLAAYFFIALQILITKIEFNIFATLGVILLPFGALRYTQFLFQRLVSAVFAYGIKLMLMYFLLTLFDSLVTQAGGIPGWTDQTNPDLAEMLKYALSYATMAFLIWKIPNLASGFMNGQPALEGHDVINSTRSAIGTGATVASLAYGGATKAASLAGQGMRRIGQSLPVGGASYRSGAGNPVARQSFGGSRIGMALMGNGGKNRANDRHGTRTAKEPQENRDE
jgi:type IV secretion system protein TrbL